MVITDKDRKTLCAELGVYWPGLKAYGDMLIVLDALESRQPGADECGKEKA
jgi:hypothetical protein